jgi:HD-like signal output (HDOD) protein
VDVLKVKKALLVGMDEDRFRSVEEALRAEGGWDIKKVPTMSEALTAVEGSEDVDLVVADSALKNGNADKFLEKVVAKRPAVAPVTLRTPAFGFPAPSSLCAIDPKADPVEAGTKLSDARSVQALIGAEPVRRLVGNLESLPCLPGSYWELMEALRRGAALADLSAIIQADPSMSLRVLQLVNSAIFGRTRRVATVQQAVSILGTELLRGLMLTANVFTAFEKTKAYGFSPEQFQAYSVRVARLAQQFGRPLGLAEDAFTAGILLDVGKLAIAVQAPEQFGEIVARSFADRVLEQDVEREILGATHAAIGGQVLTNWGIPFSVVECVTLHHHPSASSSTSELLGVVHAADSLLGIATCGEPESVLDRAYLERVGLLHHLPEWRIAAAAA